MLTDCLRKQHESPEKWLDELQKQSKVKHDQEVIKQQKNRLQAIMQEKFITRGEMIQTWKQEIDETLQNIEKQHDTNGALQNSLEQSQS